MTNPVVIVGASMGGLRTAESLARFGYTGNVVVVGDELHAPYNRPPLSKEVLATEVSHEAVAFPLRDSVAGVEWILGTAATSVDPTAHELTLADGRKLTYSALVIATGLRAQPGGPALDGRFTIRTLDDAMLLRSSIKDGVKVVVNGGGFIGCETAATLKKLGAEVTIVSRSTPLARVLGLELGSEIQRRQEHEGVHFVVGQTIAEVHEADGRVSGVTLTDGTELPCEILVDAIGSLPNTEWLAGSGIDHADGVHCDQQLRALDESGAVVPDVYAVGDVAKFPLPALCDGDRRVEHWNIPTECAKHVGRQIAALAAGEPAPAEPFAPVPSFWSDQFDVHLLSFGLPVLADRAELVAGSLDDECVFEYFAGDRLVGVAGIGMRSTVQGYRNAFTPTPTEGK